MASEMESDIVEEGYYTLENVYSRKNLNVSSEKFTNYTNINIYIGICSNAPITIFDEPTIGLDAVNRQEFYNILLESYMNKNRTIIISTHLINEVEELLEKVIMIADRKIKVNDYIDELKERSYYISGKREDLNKLSILPEMILVKVFGNNKMCAYYGDLNDEDLSIIENSDIELDKMSLQDLFINMNKKEEALYEK